MKKKYLLLSISIIIGTLQVSFAQPPTIQWQKTFGGTSVEDATSIIQTTDGGYIVTGSTNSNNGDVSGNHGNEDFWVVKIGATGNLQWQKTFGGTLTDEPNSIYQTNDGGYILAGGTRSNNGDVTGNHGTKDVWVIKIDALGSLQWQKALGGTGEDLATSIQQTTDGGYILCGETESNNGDVTGNHGSSDYWVVKLNNLGALQWQKTYGGTLGDHARSLQQTTDGGYVVTGNTNSNNGDVTGHHGNYDYWVIKVDPTGNLQWQKTLGGTLDDIGNSIQQTADGGYIVAGYTLNNDGDVTGNHGGSDFWVVKLNNLGTLQWQKTLGGSSADIASSIKQTVDGSYVVAGYTLSNNGDVTSNHGGADSWIVNLNLVGSLQWQKTLGGSTDDYARSIEQTTDGGYIVAGPTISNDGDVSGNHGSSDMWIVKLQPPNSINTANVASPLCTGSTLNVPYTVIGTYNSGNIFTAQLSNATGSFTTPTNIGNITSTSTGVINATIPLATTAGTGYRIRVVSSSPVITGTDNGSNISINQPSVAPTSISGTTTFCNPPGGTILNAVGGILGTGANYQWGTGPIVGISPIAGLTSLSITAFANTNTTYWVRIENNNTPCAATTSGVTQVLTVNQTSIAPTGATGTTTVCSGGSTTLTVAGGSKGTGAVTEWFTGSCGSTPAGTGDAITVSPTVTTTYYIRYSGACNTTTCATVTVTVHSSVVATCSNNNSTLYFGYSGDQSSTIKVVATGGTAPYTVSITMDRPLNCNVITSSGDEIWSGVGGSSINNVCPTTGSGLTPVSTGIVVSSGGFYSVIVTLMQDAIFTATVTDANGCIVTCTTSIHAEDARCFAGNSGNAKVSLCHQTGSFNNPCVKVCVAESAVAAHLAHGDFLGNCTPNCDAPQYARGVIIEEKPISTDIFQVKVIPNPTDYYFTLDVETGSNEKIVVIVYDVLGRIVEHIEKGNNELIKFGENMKEGVYLALVVQGNNRKTIKLVKQ